MTDFPAEALRVSALEAIYSRQSVTVVRPDPVPREVIEALLAAAVQAPNHYHTRPWRFVVVTGDGRRRLGQMFSDALRREWPNLHEQEFIVQREKPLKAPVAIVVGVDCSDPEREHIDRNENLCAAACATQNLLLAAHAYGLASFWKSVDAQTDPELRVFLGLTGDRYILGVIYLGYPVTTLSIPMRPGYKDRTTWIE